MVALTDVSGAAFAGYRYDAWGKVTSASTQAVAGSLSATLAADIASRQPLRYAGYCYDAESSTYYLSARQYDPVTRQFLTKDPAKADGEESAYQYCGGDPVGGVDPSGLEPRGYGMEDGYGYSHTYVRFHTERKTKKYHGWGVPSIWMPLASGGPALPRAFAASYEIQIREIALLEWTNHLVRKRYSSFTETVYNGETMLRRRNSTWPGLWRSRARTNKLLGEALQVRVRARVVTYTPDLLATKLFCETPKSVDGWLVFKWHAGKKATKADMIAVNKKYPR